MTLNDNEFECPRCGAVVTYDYARCPECGLNFYDPQTELDEPEETRVSAATGVLLGLLIGWLVSGMGAFVLHLLALQIYRVPPLPPFGRLLLFLAGPLGGFIGGYTAASIAQQRPLALGLASGILAIFNAVLLLSVWVPFEWGLLVTPLSLLEWALTLLTGVAGAYTYAKMAERAALRKLFQPPASEQELYQELLQKVRYDEATLQRLLDYERSRNPDASRRELLLSAIQRWERDNR